MKKIRIYECALHCIAKSKQTPSSIIFPPCTIKIQYTIWPRRRPKNCQTWHIPTSSIVVARVQENIRPPKVNWSGNFHAQSALLCTVHSHIVGYVLQFFKLHRSGSYTCFPSFRFDESRVRGSLQVFSKCDIHVHWSQIRKSHSKRGQKLYVLIRAIRMLLAANASKDQTGRSDVLKWFPFIPHKWDEKDSFEKVYYLEINYTRECYPLNRD